MKRLKKGEFFNSEKVNDSVVDCFVEPTSKEWNEIDKLGRGVRGIITLSGKVYLWMADIVHNRAIKLFGIGEEGVQFNSKNNNGIEIYVTRNMEPQDIQEAFKNTSTLYNYYSKNTQITDIDTAYYSAERYQIYDDVNSIQDFIDMEDAGDEIDDEECPRCGDPISECNCDDDIDECYFCGEKRENCKCE